MGVEVEKAASGGVQVSPATEGEVELFPDLTKMESASKYKKS
jgi:hypothetical protein